MKKISIRGAREHNLKSINVDIPRNKLVVITGVSGSGKSSLAFDTIYAEGQRRYVESLSAYARQFLELMQKPDVDSIDGLSPSISIEQKTIARNPRSTVGTVTEICDYLRLLYARIGIPYSPTTGLKIESQTITEMVDRILLMPKGLKIYVLAPIIRGKKGEYKKELQNMQRQGFRRVIIDSKLYNLEEVPSLEKNKKHDIEIVVDRITLEDEIDSRLYEAIENALKLSDGLVYIQNIDSNEKITFSSKFACPVSGFSIDKIEPRLFSFNSPFGACSTCNGLGVKTIFDPFLVVPDHNKSINDGAIAPWSEAWSSYYLQALHAVMDYYKVDPNLPFAKLSNEIKQIILYGSGGTAIPTIIRDQNHTYHSNKPFEGVITSLERRYKEILNDPEGERKKQKLQRYQQTLKCDHCDGYRLNEKSLSVKINSLHIGEVCDLSVIEASNWFKSLTGVLKTQEVNIAKRVLKEIQDRLSFLENVGLGYLTLSRSSSTLSGGESQRIHLASQLGSRLTGVMYVLDEPSIGLHQRDNANLLKTIKDLKDAGNTVIVVEHDEEFILSADHVIDLGPGAGIHGGNIVAEGRPKAIMDSLSSSTGAYLSGRKKIALPEKRREIYKEKSIEIIEANTNNLKNINVTLPLGAMTCVTGVSGCGKSSLVIETLYKNLAQYFNNKDANFIGCKQIKGLELIDKVIDIDQTPIGRTPRSNPATYIGVFDHIRNWFAGLPEAKTRGYTAGRFSFNVKGGRCEACQGDGVIKIEMHFLPDVYVQCEECKEQRYNRETLSVLYKEKSIADVLKMTVDEGVIFFDSLPAIREKLIVLSKVGLGYIQLGQRATTLSGGEAQRIKLAKELTKRATGKTLYILDEPTTGLSFADVDKLLEVIHSLVNQGNTVIIIEHNLDVIKTVDWIIDLGPEGGGEGGHLVYSGTPEGLVKSQLGYTSKYLEKYVVINSDN